MPSFLRPSILLAAVGGLGCSAPVVDDVADANAAMTEGVVLVERTVSGDGTTQTNVSAKFMRLSTPADPDLAERVVGSKLDLPAVGTCRSQAAAARVDAKARAPVTMGSQATPNPGALPRAYLGTIELIDVGDVTLRTGSSSMRLAARAFPDVGDLVSGMFYTSRDAASDLPAGASYTLEGTGSSLVERFSIEADAPAAPEDVRVGGAALAEGVALEAGVQATVQWRAAEIGPKTRDDLVLIDVSAPSGASIRCAFKDDGQALLPAWVLRASSLGPLPATATLAVHRVRERSFVAPGLDAGEVRFDLSVVGRAIVAPAGHASAQP
jgi:hypothetical protein